MKDKKFHKLINDLSGCNKCINLDNKSLINFYHDDVLSSSIPSIWTDWYNRLDSKVFIIGQDWGPFEDMQKLHERFIQGEDWNTLINDEKSLTKKNLEKFLKSINIQGSGVNETDQHI